MIAIRLGGSSEAILERSVPGAGNPRRWRTFRLPPVVTFAGLREPGVRTLERRRAARSAPMNQGEARTLAGQGPLSSP
jgi:hypothetical protein